MNLSGVPQYAVDMMAAYCAKYRLTDVDFITVAIKEKVERDAIAARSEELSK